MLLMDGAKSSPRLGQPDASGDVREDLGVERSVIGVPEGGVEGREDDSMRVSVEMSLLSLGETFTVCGEVEATTDNLFGDSRAVSSSGKSAKARHLVIPFMGGKSSMSIYRES